MEEGKRDERGSSGAALLMPLPPRRSASVPAVVAVPGKNERAMPTPANPDPRAGLSPTGTKPKSAALRGLLTALLDRHGLPLRRYAARLTGDAPRGHEAVRRAFVALALLPGLDELPEEKRVEKLYRACREAALASLKGEARRPRTPASAAGANAATDPVRLGLNQVQEEMLRLKFECGLGYPAIAAILDVAPAHVSNLVHAALTQVRQAQAKGESAP